MNDASHWYITGFEPFGPHAYNPSATCAEQLGAQLSAAGADVCWEVIPVTFAGAASFIPARAIPPHTTLIHLGLAASRAHISLEEVARNVHGTARDNAGEVPSGDGELEVQGDALRTSGLDLDMLRRAILRADVDRALPEVKITHDAGSYVCNALYYHSLQRAPRTVFIHLPDWTPAQAERFAHILADALLRMDQRSEAREPGQSALSTDSNS